MRPKNPYPQLIMQQIRLTTTKVKKMIQSFFTKDDIVQNTTVFRFEKSFPTLLDNQGSTYIRIGVTNSIYTESKWLLWIARNCGGVQIYRRIWIMSNKEYTVLFMHQSH